MASFMKLKWLTLFVCVVIYSTRVESKARPTHDGENDGDRGENDGEEERNCRDVCSRLGRVPKSGDADDEECRDRIDAGIDCECCLKPRATFGEKDEEYEYQENYSTSTEEGDDDDDNDDDDDDDNDDDDDDDDDDEDENNTGGSWWHHLFD